MRQFRIWDSFYHTREAFNRVLTIMMYRIYLFYFFLVFITSTVYPCLGDSQNCGIERWSVKTLSDKDTSRINFTKITKSTVHEQVTLPEPSDKTSRLESEIEIFSIDCFVVGYKMEESDKDIHIIIEDIDTDETMVIEIPSYECFEIQKTSRDKLFKNLYEWFVLNIGQPQMTFLFFEKHIPVNVTGVGFFDLHHGQIGMAGNSRELHPVLSMKLR